MLSVFFSLFLMMTKSLILEPVFMFPRRQHLPTVAHASANGSQQGLK